MAHWVLTSRTPEVLVRLHAKTIPVGLFIALSFACNSNKAAPNSNSGRVPQETDAPDPHRLSPTRQLRRIMLTLTGVEPSLADYDALAAADEATRQSRLAQAIDDALSSPLFYEQMLSFGRDYLRVGSYEPGTFEESSWVGNQAIQITPCAAGTLHQGKLGVFFPNNLVEGDPPSICNDPSARTDQIQDSWFAAGTSVFTIGRAGSGVTVAGGGADCGIGVLDAPFENAPLRLYTPARDCSCGPHLIYCHPTVYDDPNRTPTDGRNDVADSQRRAAWDEPGRLFAYVVTNDKPFSDLVVGNYTVVNLKLQHMYVRLGRLNAANRALDNSMWFLNVGDASAWREVPFEAMHPNLLSRRSYPLDPRADASEPLGVPSAGVLTTLGSMATFARERVRGARWMEIFACRAFTAPPSDQMFSPFQGDPYSGGQCQHCHRTIDPAAIFFKRLAFGDDGSLFIGGVGAGKWDDALTGSDPFSRWKQTFLPGTFLTPITAADLQFNPNARFIDFLPNPASLFGGSADGTIGPLGFGKLLVDSGEFDQCAVRRIYERMLGRPLDPTTEAPYIQQLTDQFRAGERKVKPFIKRLLSVDAFGRGW